MNYVVLMFLFSTCVNLLAQRPDIVINDFEGKDYGDWKVSGEAFGPGPSDGALAGQQPITGFIGRGLATSYHGGDRSTGRLTSPEFLIERKYIRFLVGGGRGRGTTCVMLLVNGKAVRYGEPFGVSEKMEWYQWDVDRLQGQRAQIQIIDESVISWGHIDVDQILQTDDRFPGLLSDVSKSFVVSNHYLNLPVKNNAPIRRVELSVNGETVRMFDIELADGEPDWWAFLDLTPFRGQHAVVKVDQLPEGSTALGNVEQADRIRGWQNLYDESFRPQYHFTSPRGWLNDPNGLVFLDGEYHLFYQHNPYGVKWGNMHWGHAVSTDLIHWHELGEALYPDERGAAFSGCCLVDWKNTSGLGSSNNPPLLAFYTAAGGYNLMSLGEPFTQCLAYSLDHGRTWVKYAGNPVVPHIIGENRDPDVSWYPPQKKWVMALYLDNDDFGLFSSLDCKEWARISTIKIPGSAECPHMFKIPIEAAGGQARWIFYGGNGNYLVGQFNGSDFRPEAGPVVLNYGNSFYASQTYNDIPTEDGRRILMGWGPIEFPVEFPGVPFNQQMVFPVELTLHRTEEGLRLFANPVREIKALWSKTSLIGPQALKPGGNNPLAGVQGHLLDIAADIIPNKAEKVTFQIHGVSVAFNVRSNTLSCLDKTGPLQPQDGMIKLRFLVDRASIEIFGNDGRLYMPMGIISKEPGQPLRIYSEGGEARIKHLEVHYLRSAWKDSAANSHREDMAMRNSSKQNNLNAGVESPGK